MNKADIALWRQIEVIKSSYGIVDNSRSEDLGVHTTEEQGLGGIICGRVLDGHLEELGRKGAHDRKVGIKWAS